MDGWVDVVGRCWDGLKECLHGSDIGSIRRRGACHRWPVDMGAVIRCGTMLVARTEVRARRFPKGLVAVFTGVGDGMAHSLGGGLMVHSSIPHLTHFRL